MDARRSSGADARSVDVPALHPRLQGGVQRGQGGVRVHAQRLVQRAHDVLPRLRTAVRRAGHRLQRLAPHGRRVVDLHRPRRSRRGAGRCRAPVRDALSCGSGARRGRVRLRTRVDRVARRGVGIGVTRPIERLRLVVLGMMGYAPFAGQMWLYVNWLLGLRALGHDVWYVEDNALWPYDPQAKTFGSDCSYAVEHVRSSLARIGMEREWAYRPSPSDDACVNLTVAELVELYRT